MASSHPKQDGECVVHRVHKAGVKSGHLRNDGHLHCSLPTCVYNDYSFGSPTHSVCVKVIGCVQLVRLSFNISVNI